jgi:CheY-like chemotaxis protein
MKILVVDDDAICRRLIVKGLEKAKYETVEARDAPEALALLQSDGTISLLISDIMMPEVDGLDLLDQIRRIPLLAHLPVLICSALARSDIVARAAHFSIVGYLLKPVDLPRLRAEVRRILSMRLRPLSRISETLARLEVDELGYLQMLDSFLKKLFQDLPEISELGRSGGSQQLSTLLTGLSGAAQTLGAEALSHVIASIEQANAANDPRSILSLFSEMEKAAAELKEAVQRLLSTTRAGRRQQVDGPPEEEIRAGLDAEKRPNDENTCCRGRPCFASPAPAFPGRVGVRSHKPNGRSSTFACPSRP